MGEWMDGQIGRVNGWMNGWMDNEIADGQVDSLTDLAFLLTVNSGISFKVSFVFLTLLVKMAM